MNAIKQTNLETAGAIKDQIPDAIEAANEWNDRVYLNLRHASRSFRGDTTLKFWLDNRGVLIYEAGKGTVSPPCRQDRDAILEWAKRTGFPMEKK